MSPRHAAPRMASVTAWQTTSASEWPSAPRSDGIVTPPSTSGRPRRAGADRSPVPARPVRAGVPLPAGDRLGQRQILRRRDLDVRRLALDQAHRMPGALGERRLVGRVASPRQRQRIARARRGETPAASARERSSRAAAFRSRSGSPPDASEGQPDARPSAPQRASPCRAIRAPPPRRPTPPPPRSSAR